MFFCMDANEHIYTKSIRKLLTDPNNLAMSKVVGGFTHQPLPATYFRGSKLIDVVWAAQDVQATGAYVMPCGYGIRDHRLFVVDFLISSIIGHSPTKIVQPAT